MHRLWLVIPLGILAPACLGQPLENIEKADTETVRLSPTAFPELPRGIVTELQRRGCTIPQVPMVRGRHNVIKGEFLRPGQTDWAVLCSVSRVSSILVFWNSAASNPSEIATSKDRDLLQGWAEHKMVYSWMIAPAGKKYIVEHRERYKAHGIAVPPSIDHQGINDGFFGKASVVRYFYRGQWLALAGAD